jgi:hypothetical protein
MKRVLIGAVIAIIALVIPMLLIAGLTHKPIHWARVPSLAMISAVLGGLMGLCWPNPHERRLRHPAFKSIHVGWVPWCYCCGCRVPADHVCECEK